jgi:hypothetical protein
MAENGRAGNRPCLAILALDLPAYVFDRLAELAAALPESLLNFARCLILNAFVVQALVIGQIARRLLDLALELLGLAIDFVSIHWEPPPSHLQEAVPEQ